jgi:tripartite-type tricarboxylate transporter receptor subunit TctC
MRTSVSKLLIGIVLAAATQVLAACGGGQTPQNMTAATPQDIQKQAQEYFSGKIITIEVGYSPGGGQDTNARLTAKYLGKHIPGNPQIVVENRTGSDGLIAGQYAMQQSADGLNIVLVNNILPQKAALSGQPLPGFDVFHAAVLGNMQVTNRPYDNYMVCVRSDLAQNYQQLLGQVKQLGRPLTAGVFRGGSWGAILPTYFNMPFKPVAGYTGTDAILQAMDQNELEVLVDGCNFEQIDRLHPDWLKKPSRIMPVLNIDGSDLTPLKSMFDAAGWEIPPRIDEALTLTDSQNQLLKAGVDASTTTTHEWMVRGDTPAWILQVERDALKEVTEDTAFMADMEKINRKAGYVTPEQYDEYYRSLQNYTGDLKDAMTIFAGLTGQ